jgi:hypothetical protein
MLLLSLPGGLPLFPLELSDLHTCLRQGLEPHSQDANFKQVQIALNGVLATRLLPPELVLRQEVKLQLAGPEGAGDGALSTFCPSRVSFQGDRLITSNR